MRELGIEEAEEVWEWQVSTSTKLCPKPHDPLRYVRIEKIVPTRRLCPKFLKTQINQRYWANYMKNERMKQIVLTQETRKTDIDDQKLISHTGVQHQ